MQKFKQDLIEYTRCVGRHWWVLVVVVVFAVLGGAQDMFDYDFPNLIWWGAIVTGLLLAQFMAWQDMKAEREKYLKADIDNAVLTQITEMRSEVIAMLNEMTSDDGEAGVLRYKYEQWRSKTRDYLDVNISSGEAGIFYRIGTFTWMAPPTAKNFEEMKARSMMAHDANHLKELISDYSRGKLRK